MFARIRGWPLAAVAVGLVTAGRGVAAPITFIAPARLSGIQTSHTVFGDFSMWVATSALADEIVTVHQGSGYMDILYWYTSRPSGWPDSYEGMLAGHEVGHMIGIYDEYYGGAANPSPFYTTADLGPVQARYYTRMVDWLEVTSGRPSLNPAADSAPEPAAATLIAIGILGVLASRPKSTRM